MNEFHEILNKAHEAARAASEKFFKEVLGGQDKYACGFGWVEISTRRDTGTMTKEFIKFCRSELKKRTVSADHREKYQVEKLFGHQGYKQTWDWWNPGDYSGQNVDTKEAGAKAFAEVLRNHGIQAWAYSRLD